MFYGNNDWRDYLAHSWGTSPKQKAREKEYNHEYWLKNKERIMRQRKRAENYHIRPEYVKGGTRTNVDATDSGTGTTSFRRRPYQDTETSVQPTLSNRPTPRRRTDGGVGSSVYRRTETPNPSNAGTNVDVSDSGTGTARARYGVGGAASSNNAPAAKIGYQQSQQQSANVSDSGTGNASSASSLRRGAKSGLGNAPSPSTAAAKKTGQEMLQMLIQ